jgi:cell wall-associated NlpC family hydrolase
VPPIFTLMLVRALAVVVIAAATAACASGGAVRAPAVLAPPLDAEAPVLPPAEALGYRIAATALEFRGVPYRNGGTTPSGFDCSGLVRYVFAQYGREMPRQARDQFDAGKRIGRDDVRAGDLVFFDTSGGVSHVGIALDGEEFVHAPNSRGVVRVERLATDYWRRRFVGARRVP